MSRLKCSAKGIWVKTMDYWMSAALDSLKNVLLTKGRFIKGKLLSTGSSRKTRLDMTEKLLTAR